MAGIYIHIPFCKSRCIYCDFFSTLHLDKGNAYVQRLLQEMEQRKNELPTCAREYHSLYIGGGTPSILPHDTLLHLIHSTASIFQLQEGAEVTIEANPDDVTPEWIEMLKETPVNRVSMGVQTFHDELLRFLHRRHSCRQAFNAVNLLQKNGYQNISIDLIYGIPGQDKEIWWNDVEKALQLGIPHLSAYSLMYEEGTRLTQLRDEGKLKEMDEEDSLQYFEHLCDRLSAAGYEHYEISNFARPGFHSRHNSSYWEGVPYLGFGAGAHSYNGDKTRIWNKSDLMGYIANGPSVESEQLSETDLYNEYVMTRLRTQKGISLKEVKERFGDELTDYLLEQAKPHLAQGNLQERGHIISLTRGGIFVSNQVMSDLFKELS